MKTYYIVSGGFDPIHEGHVEMIKASAQASDGVIVLANSDDWLCRKKGKNFHTMKTRKAILENLKGVVDVLEFDDTDNSACDVLKKPEQSIRTPIWYLQMAVIAEKIIFRRDRLVRLATLIWLLVLAGIIKQTLHLGF